MATAHMKSVRWEDKAIRPTKIVCVGRNYAGHIAELDNQMPEQPVFFLKPNSAIAEHIHSSPDMHIDYEGEISFLIMSGEIAAVGFGLDLTRRELQSYLKQHGLPWERAKSFDNSAVFSHFVSFNGNPDTLTLELLINDQLRQHGGTAQMINKPGQLLRAASSFLTFEDGDILMTGTPAGVGAVNTGDRYRARISKDNNVLIEQQWIVI